MRIFQRLRDLAQLLQEYEGCFAICGDVAASIYRDTPRYTGAIDVCLMDFQDRSAKLIATSLVEALGYKPIAGFVSSSGGKLVSERALVIGRESESQGFIGIDFLLPVLPWIPKAVRRAQANKLDYGFCRLATITKEDLILAKIYALNAEPGRLKDLDDIEDIVKQATELDCPYLREQIADLGLQIPEASGLQAAIT